MAFQFIIWQEFPTRCKKISCEDILSKFSWQQCCWRCRTFSSTEFNINIVLTREMFINNFQKGYASVNSSCDHPPRGTVWGICSCVYPRALLPPGIITPGHLSLTEKRPRPQISFVVCQNGQLLNMLNKFYITVECWFSSVNQYLRFSFSPYYIYCIYNEKLSAIKASVSQPFVDVFI